MDPGDVEGGEEGLGEGRGAPSSELPELQPQLDYSRSRSIVVLRAG